ncbi:RagB/SusD family nutrient uptake outer membrane protein [Algoriphagus sp. D3-2-R+10]|uniref:RagB/SusD family nutrient uptake outer membrane protein n=1 Tax=Algoriphagus aurantiacus TaxID=3103948 RepID=UPI002B37B36B|nr:RagB/SusD family nutrient uptake outer membrane protein [Algoriphagus sp. D3-2-R+10]MEB2773840.1 RagB/SusD family nutrient uptake outer membrane protein [Algoriphagus sp. D3-2-R+10]
MKNLRYIYLVIFLAFAGCNNDEFLDREPTDILGEDQVWANDDLVFSVLADLYNRLPDYQGLENWWEYANFDETFASNAGDYWRHQNQEYGYGDWGMWNYGYIRDLNLFIQKCEEATEISAESKARFLAEAKFIRAMVYFEHVKRMGGVPLILEPLEYDYSGDPTYLQYPRAKEHEIYDFVIAEMEEVKDDLPNGGTKSRATKGAALSLISRAALYAGSIANYGQLTPEVSLPGGEVGIPAGMADGYYTTALNASEEVMGLGTYELYNQDPDKSENYTNIFLNKTSNNEVIMAKDFLVQGRTHGFTIETIPRSLREENTSGGKMNPSLNLIQSYELLDNTFAELPTKDASGNPIYYDDPMDIFEGRDPRLMGTVVVPGSTFRGQEVDIWAGYKLEDGSVITSGQLGGQAQLPGSDASVQVVGFDGPIDQLEWSAQNGFYLRKYVDTSVGSGQRGTGSAVWLVRFRYAEILLNAAEAAFELGQLEKAADYMNQVRRRAGFPVDLTSSEIDFDRIVHERKVELAFENHILWDKKRWRLAHRIWNGVTTDLTNNPSDALAVSTRVFGLKPYKYYEPGSPNDGKWIFEEFVPAPVFNAHRFRLGNYYSFIGDNVRNNNPKIVRNPNQ